MPKSVALTCHKYKQHYFGIMVTMVTVVTMVTIMTMVTNTSSTNTSTKRSIAAERSFLDGFHIDHCFAYLANVKASELFFASCY